MDSLHMKTGHPRPGVDRPGPRVWVWAFVLASGVWLLREGLLAEAEYNERKVARRPAWPLRDPHLLLGLTHAHLIVSYIVMIGCMRLLL